MKRLTVATTLFAASSVFLASCAPSLVGANEAGGIVNANFNMGQGKALDAANRHCAKFDKIARVTGQNEIRNSVTFECVAKS